VVAGHRAAPGGGGALVGGGGLGFGGGELRGEQRGLRALLVAGLGSRRRRRRRPTRC